MILNLIHKRKPVALKLFISSVYKCACQETVIISLCSVEPNAFLYDRTFSPHDANLNKVAKIKTRIKCLCFQNNLQNVRTLFWAVTFYSVVVGGGLFNFILFLIEEKHSELTLVTCHFLIIFHCFYCFY